MKYFYLVPDKTQHCGYIAFDENGNEQSKEYNTYGAVGSNIKQIQDFEPGKMLIELSFLAIVCQDKKDALQRGHADRRDNIIERLCTIVCREIGFIMSLKQTDESFYKNLFGDDSSINYLNRLLVEISKMDMLPANKESSEELRTRFTYAYSYSLPLWRVFFSRQSNLRFMHKQIQKRLEARI